MGSYASWADVHYPTQADSLNEYCTACMNTGWVEYPRTVHEIELDPCPYGCVDSTELLDAGQEWAIDHGHADQWEALVPPTVQTLPDPEMERLARLMLNETIQARATDPLLALSKQFERGKSKFESSRVDHARHHGRVASDDYIPGFMRAGREVKHISIPPYLVGTVMDWDEDYAHIRYEYYGSFLDVFVARTTLLNRMRFAYSWDRSHTIHEIMG